MASTQKLQSRQNVNLRVSVRLGLMASTMVGERQQRVSRLSILYWASLIKSCSRCSSTCGKQQKSAQSVSPVSLVLGQLDRVLQPLLVYLWG